MSYETLEVAVQALTTTNAALVNAVTGTQQEASSAIAIAEASALAAGNSEAAAQASAVLADQKALEAGNKASAANTSAGIAATKASEAKSSAETAVAVTTGGTASLTPAAGKIPIANNKGEIPIEWLGPDVVARIMMASTKVNDIGTPGAVGFGVGICPLDYQGISSMPGTTVLGSDDYGNYKYSDGSVMCWVPAFFYRYGDGSNPSYPSYGVNSVDVLPRHAYPTILAAAVAGYAFHRAFWDDGVEQPGVFVDKYLCSNNEGVASSVKNGNAMTSAANHYPFSGLTGSPANNLSGAITAVKTRGADFFAATPFIPGMLALLSLAHGQSATSDAACAWYSASTTNFPKGCNNNALGDSNDASVAYTSTGHETYPNCGKTGSGLPFAKTTHNGQACGVADINGLLWEINPGLTFLDGNYYILSPDARAADLTPGLALPTDAWGATGLAASHLLVGPSIGALGSNPAGATLKVGSANQVLSSATEGIEWAAAGAGIPQLDGVGGTNLFGNDGFYDNQPTHMCTAAGGHWSNSAIAGPWARSCRTSRTLSVSSCGVRAALYLVRKSDSE